MKSSTERKETSEMKETVNGFNQIDEIEEDLERNRRRSQKFIFMISKSKRAKIWTKEEDEELIKQARKNGYRNWNAIARHLPGRTSVQCTARFKRLKPGIIKGSWSLEEDELLKNLVTIYGRNWSTVARYMPSRNGKQIRDRFLNALDPLVLKEKFTEGEDENILKYYKIYGSAWSKIVKFFPGRTADIIKNRFYSTLRKRVHRREYDQTLKRRKLNRDKIKLMGRVNQHEKSPKFNELRNKIFEEFKGVKEVREVSQENGISRIDTDQGLTQSKKMTPVRDSENCLFPVCHSNLNLNSLPPQTINFDNLSVKVEIFNGNSSDIKNSAHQNDKNLHQVRKEHNTHWISNSYSPILCIDPPSSLKEMVKKKLFIFLII
jgi:hypothetical protein